MPPFTSATTRFASTLLLLLFLTGCGNYSDKEEIHKVLDARDLAVSKHDISSYTLLLMQGYSFQGQSEFDVISRMRTLFKQFDATRMQSGDRVIRFPDNSHAQCEQNYQLQVKVGNEWRKVHQRERILFTRTADGWKISGGL